MKQLVMKWKNDNGAAVMPAFPVGVTLKNWSEVDNAVQKWLDIVSCGLTEKLEDEEYYKKCNYAYKNYRPEDCWFFLLNGKEVATVTLIYDNEILDGYVHMVAVKDEARGSGLGNLLGAYATYLLKINGMRTAYLTTDDWRIPAIKTYLKSGFYPVTDGEDFKCRWKKIYDSINGKRDKADKIKIGVLGGYRGTSMIKFLKDNEFASVVAICDKSEDVLNAQKAFNEGLNVKYYRDFDEMLNSDIDAVVLANYANEHAPFAIRSLKSGKHVFSEVLPVQNLKEAVELIEAVEASGRGYAYGENYCYMPAPLEMKRLYESGVLGEFEYGEGEYVHNCEPIWHDITYGEENHWRNLMYANFYCTHSIGPLIHITKLRPISVVGFEGTKTERKLRVGAKGGQFGIEMITLSNGGIIKSIHGDLYKDSIWYSVYGGKGRAESAREDTGCGVDKIYVNVDEYSGEYAKREVKAYYPEIPQRARDFGHGGSDYISMLNFIKKIKGDTDADIIDVYEALDMFLPGLMAYRSVLKGGVPVDIPNLRDKAERERYRHDTACVDANAAGDQLLPTYSMGTPDIDAKTYDIMRKKYQDGLKNGDDYINGIYK